MWEIEWEKEEEKNSFHLHKVENPIMHFLKICFVRIRVYICFGDYFFHIFYFSANEVWKGKYCDHRDNFCTNGAWTLLLSMITVELLFQFSQDWYMFMMSWAYIFGTNLDQIGQEVWELSCSQNLFLSLLLFLSFLSKKNIIFYLSDA